MASSKISSKLETEPKSETTVGGTWSGEKSIMVDKKTYSTELARLQVELVKLQEWVRFKGSEGGGYF